MPAERLGIVNTQHYHPDLIGRLNFPWSVVTLPLPKTRRDRFMQLIATFKTLPDAMDFAVACVQESMKEVP